MRKRRLISKKQPIEEETFENFTKPTKKSKRQIDKAAQIAAQKIFKKYKNIRFRKKMKEKKADFKAARDTFNKLTVDLSSAAFAKEILDKKLLLELKKSRYAEDKQFFKLNLLENKSNNVIFEPDSANRSDYVEKKEIDHLTLYSSDARFRSIHADVGNLEFLGKNATIPQYVLVLVDLFSTKVYTYPMKYRKQIHQKLGQFCREVIGKRKGKKMKLQVDQEFQQVKIKDLNEQNNVHS